MIAAPIEELEVNGLRAKLVRPRDTSRAGILVLPHWPGADESTMDVAQKLAEEGFTALAWDPFSAYPRDVSAEERRRLTREVITDATARAEQSFWTGWLRGELGLDSIGAIGFCMGGRQTFVTAASERRWKAICAFYPTMRMPVPANALSAIEAGPEVQCPAMVHYPGLDEATTYETFSAVRSALESRGRKAITLAHYYPDAEHGFLGEERQSHAGNAEASAIAWPLTVAFFRTCLLS
jgi:carboxymethylenebutenolidase